MNPNPPSPPDQPRFLRLFLASEREVRRTVMAMVPSLADAEDIVQQTAAVLWEKFGEYDEARPFTPWACRFAQHHTRRWLERRAIWQRLLEHGLAEELTQRREALRPEMERRLAALEKCVEKLPVEQRRIVTGYYSDRTGIGALAAAQGRSVEAVYKMLQRIRQALLECVRTTTAREVEA